MTRSDEGYLSGFALMTGFALGAALGSFAVAGGIAAAVGSIDRYLIMRREREGSDG